MNSSRQPHLLNAERWIILVVVGVLGLLITAWVTRSLYAVERERLEYRFQLSAQARAGEVADQLRQPLEHLATLQHLFSSVAQVDWEAFRKFTEPMFSQPGLLSYNWFPKVAVAERSVFERDGRQLWGERFAIEEQNSAGGRMVAAARDYYFPLLYSVPEASGRANIGFDLYSVATRVPVIDRAISGHLPTSSEIDTLLVDRQQGDAVLFVAPAYRRGMLPVGSEAGQSEVRGIVVVILSVGKLFAAANASLSEAGFNVRLLDLSLPAEKQRLAEWTSRLESWDSPAGEPPLIYAKSINLASHVWSVQIEATPAWVDLNSSRGLRFVPVFGILATLLLLLYLRTLLGRSALADSLERGREDDLKLRRAAETWANKLSLAVEQNPAAIYITDLAGRIEYVNEQFVETTGYSRAEAIGQDVRITRPSSVDESVYQVLWATIAAGQSWQGDLECLRRDGTLIWNRLLVSPLKDSQGRVTNYVMTRENIGELRQMMLRLHESEGRFRGAMSVMAEGLAIISAEGKFLFANRVAEEFLGFAETGLLGQRTENIMLERLREDGTIYPFDEYPTRVTLRDGREVRDAVMGLRNAGGSVRWLQVNTSALRIGDQARSGAVMTFSDITERRRADEQLKLAFEAIRQSGEGILITDPQQVILSVNPAFETVTGYRADQVIGKTPEVIASNRHDHNFYAAIHESLESTGHWRGEVWNRRQNGEIYPEWLGVSVVRESDGRPKYFIYIFSDMSERQAAQQRIEFLAHHDPLTGLPNRLLLRDRMEQAQALAIRSHSRIALMFLDLDRFKTINDSLGHPVGDALLKEVVERLKGCVRDSDTISRQGGDEFVILLNEVRDGDAVSRVADKIHQRMGEPIMLGNHSLITSFSIGIALFPDDGDEFDSLLQKADTAMYHAKAAGRNGHRFFTELMNRQVVEHLTLETQLRQALENKEFVLHYQPQLDLHESGIIGVEALIRWNSPENGLISPARFIPVAEDSGMIVQIGAWVIGEACRQARAWQDAGLPPFVVAVNLSAVQFRRPDLVNTVINALVLSDLDSQWLELELTESILIQDAEATLDSVRRLKALGVRLSVDDFGTGYSSLAYLKRFSVDKLKIDQSFIRDLVSDPDDAAIVRAIIQMAHSLKLKTIAEGVETEELANLLRIFHCDEIQGFWFARPMPADELEAFVRAHPSPAGQDALFSI
jgi:diguanylate cyclase (GGDEF)-like protein/PAS domain S-box-containing protein